MGFIRGWEWIIILIVVLLIWGPSKLPQLARSVGTAITEFKKGVKSVKDDINEVVSDTDKPDSTGNKTT